MIKFLLISNMYPTEQNPGYGIFVKNISDNLGKYGIKESSKVIIKGKSKSRFDKIKKYLYFYSQLLVKFWKKYDFIYIHFPNQALPILYPLLHLRRQKLIINLHGEDLMYKSEGYSNLLGKLMEKTCYKFATSIIVPSFYFKNIIVQREIITSDKIIVSPSGGINENIFTPKDIDSIGNNTLLLGYVGRLEKDKGILEYLQVCKYLNLEGFDFSGIIIGYGSQYDYTEKFLVDNNLSQKIELIPGVAQSKLGNFYRKMDLLLFNSSRASESLGLTGIEAMACGTPVIGSRIGGISTYIHDGYNGWLTPLHDIEAIVSTIKLYTNLSQDKKIYMYHNCVTTGERYYSEMVTKDLAYKLIEIIK